MQKILPDHIITSERQSYIFVCIFSRYAKTLASNFLKVAR